MEQERFHPESEEPSNPEETERDIYQISEKLKQKMDEETELHYEGFRIVNINPRDYGPPDGGSLWTESQGRKFSAEERRLKKQLDKEGQEKLEALERRKSELIDKRDKIAEEQEPLQKELISKSKTFEELIQTLQKIPTWIGIKEIFGTIGPWYYPTEDLIDCIKEVRKGKSINIIPRDISGLREKVTELLGEQETLRERVIKATNSPEYQEAIENDAGCVELSLIHTLSELRPDLDLDYSTIKEITGKEKDVAGTVPFKMLKELSGYGIEASYYTSINPKRLQQDGLDYLVEVFGESSRKEFENSYDIEQAKTDSINAEPYIKHDQLTIEDLREFLNQGQKVIVFVDAAEQYAELIKIGLIEQEHNPDALILHSIEVEAVDEDHITIYDPMGLFPDQLPRKKFLEIWTVGPQATRETLVLKNK